MWWLTRLQMQLRMLFYRTRSRRQLDQELQFHLDRQTAENMEAGMNAEDAHYAARRAFGSPTALRDETRSTWRWNGLESFWRDVRYGAITLRRTPGFLLVARFRHGALHWRFYVSFHDRSRESSEASSISRSFAIGNDL